MAADAAVRLHGVEPFGLARRFADRELALRRDREHRIPVDGRVILRRRAFVRRDAGFQAQRGPARSRLDFFRVDESIAAYPDLIARLRQVRNDEAAPVIRHYDPGELGRQLVGLGDHPDTGLGRFAVGDDALDALRVSRADYE